MRPFPLSGKSISFHETPMVICNKYDYLMKDAGKRKETEDEYTK